MNERERFQPTEANTAASIHRIATLANAHSVPVAGELGLEFDYGKVIKHYAGEGVSVGQYGSKTDTFGQIGINAYGDDDTSRHQAVIEVSQQRASGDNSVTVVANEDGVSVTAHESETMLFGKVTGDNPQDLKLARNAAARMFRRARKIRHQEQDKAARKNPKHQTKDEKHKERVRGSIRMIVGE